MESSYLSTNTKISNISGWIEKLPHEATAYLDPVLPSSSLQTLRSLWKRPSQPSRKRRALGEVPLNTLRMSSKRQKLLNSAPPLSQNTDFTTPVRSGRKRGRTHGAEEENETPRPILGSITTFDPPRSYSALSLLEGNDSTNRSVPSIPTSTRSTSPIKRVGDLQLISRKITYATISNEVFPLPTAAKEITSRMRRIAMGEGLIPESLKPAAQKHIEEYELGPHNFSTTKSSLRNLVPGTLPDADIWAEVKEIKGASALCEDDMCSESAWNSEVHSRLLRLALRGWRSARQVSYMDLTTARIDSTNGGVSKMVDYALILVPDPQTHEAITSKLRSNNLQSINHTKAEYVRFKPITVSMETKRPGMDEDSAKVQLGVWAQAHLERLRILSAPHSELPILPEVIIQGHDWRLKIASMTIDGDVVLHGDWAIGDTRTIIGIYKIIEAIQALADWSTNVYRPWFLREVLGNLDHACEVDYSTVICRASEE